MGFRYLRDPLFLLCLAAYLVNRLVLKAVWTEGFPHEHLNDLICIPFWVPVMLFAQRRLGLRDDAPPRPAELVIPLVLWSWVFEIVLPAADGRFVGDHLDVMYYSLGALGAGVFWRWRYRGAGEGKPQHPAGRCGADRGLREGRRAGGALRAAAGVGEPDRGQAGLSGGGTVSSAANGRCMTLDQHTGRCFPQRAP